MRHVSSLLVVLLFSALIPAVAHADPDPDPHMPDPNTNFCPGGGSGNAPLLGAGRCDGIKYPDGSYWHTDVMQMGPYPMPYYMHDDITTGLHCVIDDGSPDPAPAPPGGCDGAVK
ncbi:hypothetical protein MSIMFB_02464 [Mycobacterium simulans]|uniref:Secreted protein n=1 Tax=Mycobacterium simulans TaxID=627089 RepID=A0A7Z7ILN8_9MYCO|nr:hypothetical protein [Mycobacterium simulans]SOJ54973.1 hypothetical protein MSIMFB_02464 [Mycobacterium simulans]SON63280.1 hypothetical protein MSIMFI_04810 [Mycobacterium simulans]